MNKNKAVNNIDKFHQTKKGKLIFGVIELAISYALISRAIETGSLWQYLIAIILLIGGLNNLVKAVVYRGNKSNAKGSTKKR